MSQLFAISRTEAPGSEDTLTLTARIRQGTSAQHARCETQVELGAMASSIEAYGDALEIFQKLQEFVMAHTAAAVALAPAELGAGLRRARARVEADLRALGRPARTAGPELTVADLSDLDGQLGAWYVLEGSALGGRVIARRIRDSLGDAAGALSYFSGEGHGTAARWQRFQSFANRLERCGAVGYDEVLRGAERTYDHFLTLPALR
jgi:heme oxygenase